MVFDMQGRRTVVILTVLLPLFLFQACGKKAAQPEDRILVKIDDTISISVNEFIRRAEYTPRPDFCRNNDYIAKKIILNSLIAEKLLALEAGEDNPLRQDEEFQLFIKGRKEQAMRQWMHHVEATNKVVLDSAEVRQAYQMAGREYEIAFFSTRDTSLVKKIGSPMVESPEIFDQVFQQISGDSAAAPQRKVKWRDPENPQVHQALFSSKPQIGMVLPPIQIDQEDYLFVKILGWSDDMAITERQRQERLTEVNEKLTQSNATKIWNQRVAEIMRGKRMEFDPDVFQQMNDLFFSVYFRTDEQRRQQLSAKVWDNEEPDFYQSLRDMPMAELLEKPFFKVGDEVWSVDRFRKELISHPLVFRDRQMPASEFAAQFRLAIADLVRDYYVTREAYRNGYDEVNLVQRDEAMWEDAFVALYQRTQYLKSVGETRNFPQNYHEILQKDLNSYVRELQTKHYKKIEMDFDAFEAIVLTSIDMLAKQPDQPFKYLVPNFPILTYEHLIDYITKEK